MNFPNLFQAFLSKGVKQPRAREKSKRGENVESRNDCKTCVSILSLCNSSFDLLSLNWIFQDFPYKTIQISIFYLF